MLDLHHINQGIHVPHLTQHLRRDDEIYDLETAIFTPDGDFYFDFFYTADRSLPLKVLTYEVVVLLKLGKGSTLYGDIDFEHEDVVSQALSW